MEVTLFGITMLVILLHVENAYSPIFLKLFGREMYFIEVLFKKALFPIILTGYPPRVSGILTWSCVPTYAVIVASPFETVYVKSSSGDGD